MLGQLFGSNARVKILKIFLLHPDQKYYIRELARNLKLQVNSVRRELENLEKFGLLVSKTGVESVREEPSKEDLAKLFQGKIVKSTREEKKEIPQKSAGQEKKYYQTNKNFILYEEIKALVVKSQILHEKDFVEKLQKIGSPKLIVLTGIFVNKQNSVVDMFLVGKFDKNKLSSIVKELEKELGREINFSVMDQKEFKYRRDITDIFLYDILEGKKIIVVDELGIT